MNTGKEGHMDKKALAALIKRRNQFVSCCEIHFAQ